MKSLRLFNNLGSTASSNIPAARQCRLRQCDGNWSVRLSVLGTLFLPQDRLPWRRPA